VQGCRGAGVQGCGGEPFNLLTLHPFSPTQDSGLRTQDLMKGLRTHPSLRLVQNQTISGGVVGIDFSAMGGGDDFTGGWVAQSF
jgi:hypothetical protein